MQYQQFTPEMRKTHTILVPNMLPIHFRLLIFLPYGRRRRVEKCPQRYLLPGIACCWAIYGGSEKRQI